MKKLRKNFLRLWQKFIFECLQLLMYVSSKIYIARDFELPRNILYILKIKMLYYI